ncbi:hypothetical protein EHW97_10525 [Aeromicrobium camelliae]|uniref:Uncharacterized protein n=1 Tax=Aeromicrobium camelliae TaxID=1538144 RepID=A0A3N6Y013_9ACTN|nr:hypothetical protein [Aeromicrobium camelliae]RQN03314.1 hypothetical protein EHW97_10525 [Aeromicrobium camelliae]
MDLAEVQLKVQLALLRTFKEEHALFEYRASERSIVHQLALRVRDQFPNFDVDVEYNRESGQGDVKCVHTEPGKRLLKRRRLPDLVVHHREAIGTNSNLLCLEAKTAWSPGGITRLDGDSLKVQALMQTFGYRHGVALELHPYGESRWFTLQEGAPVEVREDDQIKIGTSE